MIKSMTGFSSLTREDDLVAISVTLRAVNHRYLDVQVRVPQSLQDQESRIRGLLQQAIARGRVEVGISLQFRRPPVPTVELNDAFVSALELALERARARGVIAGHLTPGDLLRLPHALSIRDQPINGVAEQDGDAVNAAVAQALTEAIGELERMRVHEGAHLREDLETRRRGLSDLIERIAHAAANGQNDLQSRLAARIAELTADQPLDRSLLAQEVVRMVGRSDISEEITRFRAHLQHWATLAEAPEPCGRKLDFLLQEMNREINTIGSKADGQAVSELVVTAKAELEKMREQVQNVE
jgi:uncharacterized protein (TIGR00255 family)